MFAKLRELKLPRWGLFALSVVLSAALVNFVRSSAETGPDPVEAATTAREFASIDPLPTGAPDSESRKSLDPETLPGPGASPGSESPADPRHVPDGFVGEDLASLPPTPVDDGDLPEPMDVSAHRDAPAATQLLAIETSTIADGNLLLIQLRANGSISDAEIFAVVDPDRLVIDLPGMVSAMESSRVEVDSTRVARVRVGQHDGMVRVVLDSGSGAEDFGGRRVEPAPDGLRITLGSHDERNGRLAEVAAHPQPVASIAPARAPEAVQPAQKGRQLPLYLMSDETEGRHPDSGLASGERYDCIIEPYELVEVGSALTAVVESVGVERSDFVTEGQVVAQLKASPVRARVDVASARARMNGNLLASRARMDLGRRRLTRADQLFESEALSADIRDETQTEAEIAKAVDQEARERKKLMELEHLEAFERLKEYTIRSPVSGVVVERLKSPGEVVKEETIVVVAQIDPLRVEVVLPAALFGLVETGMRAEVVPQMSNSGVQIASVTIVDRVVDPTSGTFGVRLELPNADHAVPSGLRCQVRFLQVD